jgi:hypothetical protein
VDVYTLLGSHFGARPVPISLGSGAAANVVAAGALSSAGDTRLLLVNLDQTQPESVTLQGSTARAAEMWWIRQDASRPDGASTLHHALLQGSRITVPAWGIAVVRLQAG